MSKTFQIGEIADFFDIPSSTLRYWEEKGIIKPHKNENNQYREYELSDFMEISDIMVYKSLGVSLNKIKNLKQQNVDEHFSLCEQQMIALEHQEKLIQLRKNKIKQYQKSLNDIIYLKEHPFEKQKIDTECIISFDLTNLHLLKKYIENPYLYSRVQHSDDLDQETRGMTIFKREYQKDDRLLWEDHNHDYIVCLMKEEHKEGYPNDLKELVSYVQKTYQTGYVISRFLGMINEDGKVYDFYKTYIEIINKI